MQTDPSSRFFNLLVVVVLLGLAPALPAHAQEVAEAPSENAAQEEDEGGIRFTGVRIGVSLGGGFFVGDVGGGLGGVGVHLGAQLGPLGIVYKLHFFAGYYTSGGISEYFAAAWNTLLVDYELSSFILGLGPSMDFIWNCEAEACQDGGPYFGFEGRFGVKISSFKVGLGVHPTFLPGGAIATVFLFFGF
jgi:hypothetical protein